MFLFLLLYIGSPTGRHIENIVYCDRVIYEHYYHIDEPDKLVYKELIFYEQDPSNKAWYVRDWIMLDKDRQNQSMIYIYNKTGDYHTFTIYRDKKKYIIKTRIYLEVMTISEKDLERQNQDIIKLQDRKLIW